MGMKKKDPVFDTILIRLHRPFCKCMSAVKPSKNAYAIFLPNGGSPLTLRCKSCGKELQVRDKELNGNVVYRKAPTPKPDAKETRTPSDWETVGALFSQAPQAERKTPANNQEPGAQEDPRTASTEPEQKPTEDDSSGEQPDKRPAYMRALGLEEQR